MEANNDNEMRERFCNILRETGRENIDYVIEDLTDMGFFEAPASSQGHGAYAGGLVEHSLGVYDMAMEIREATLKRRPDLAKYLTPEKIAISALLHDVCKADRYRLTRRKRRNEVGLYEEQEVYEVHDEMFPCGHGEKSVIQLLRSGLDLDDDEVYAIRWHMGPWNMGKEDEKYYRQASKQTPLQAVIHTADTLASAVLERN